MGVSHSAVAPVLLMSFLRDSHVRKLGSAPCATPNCRACSLALHQILVAQASTVNTVQVQIIAVRPGASLTFALPPVQTAICYFRKVIGCQDHC